MKIKSFHPEPYTVLKEIPVTITKNDNYYVAEYHEANISMSGDTEKEAIENLKSFILDSLDCLRNMQNDSLGPAMLKQKQVLLSTIKEKTKKDSVCGSIDGPTMVELLELANNNTPPTHCDKCCAAYEALFIEPQKETIDKILELFNKLLEDQDEQ
jgi:hypothetical protein